jgi:hypothetical protein
MSGISSAVSTSIGVQDAGDDVAEADVVTADGERDEGGVGRDGLELRMAGPGRRRQPG